MLSSDFREEARRRLNGKWGKVAIMTLAYTALFFVIGFIEGLFSESVQSILSLAELVIEIPLGFGLVYAYLKVFNGEDVSAFDFVTLGFNNFKKSWGVTLNTALKMIVPIILIIVSYIFIAISIGSMAYAYVSSSVFSSAASPSISGVGMAFGIIGFILLIVSMIWTITKGYYYQLSMLIAIDNPDMTSKDAVLKSQELMTGNRGKLFCLQLSFIGWSILATITLGIGFLWLLPYMQFAIIAFYKHLSGDSSNNEVVSNVEQSNDNNENL